MSNSFSSPFELIGVVYDKGAAKEIEFYLGIAVDHMSGRLPNATLLKMSDQELNKLAYSPNGVWSEKYQYPSDPTWCKRRDDGTIPGDKYEGPHRAVAIMEYRKAMAASQK